MPPPPSAWAIAHTLLAASFCIKRPYQRHRTCFRTGNLGSEPSPSATRRTTMSQNLGSREMRVEAIRRGFVLPINIIGSETFKGVMECSHLVTTLKGNALIQSPDAPSQQPTVPDGASQTHTPSQGGIRLELPPHVAKSFLYPRGKYPLWVENPIALSSSSPSLGC
jgi:hypothetical protein